MTEKNTMVFSKNKIILFIFACAFLPTASASALTEQQRGAISQYCGTIQQTLKTLQQSDSRTRLKLGAFYETFSSKYIVPLNTRLVKNNQINTALATIQSDFSSLRSSFSTDFISYSRSLEELTAFDCKNSPDEFYEKLSDTREKRALVRNDTKKLKTLLINFKTEIQQLKESL